MKYLTPYLLLGGGGGGGLRSLHTVLQVLVILAALKERFKYVSFFSFDSESIWIW